MAAQRRILDAVYGAHMQEQSLRNEQSASRHPIQLSTVGGTQDVLLKVENIQAQGSGSVVPADGTREVVLIQKAIDTMTTLLVTLQSAALGSSLSCDEFRPAKNELNSLLKTLTAALTKDDEKLTGDFIDAEATFYDRHIVPAQTKLMTEPQAQREQSFVALRNGFDSVHVVAQLINNLRAIRYSQVTTTPDTTVAVEVGGFIATAQSAKDANSAGANLPATLGLGANDIYLWNVARIASGGALREVMERAAAVLKIKTPTFYFHAQPWVVKVYTSSVGAKVVP